MADVAGAGLRFGAQVPSTHFNDSQSDGSMQLPPLGTRVFVGVTDGVVVNVTVAVAVTEGVAVVVLVAVTVAVVVGVGLGFSWQVLSMRLQKALAVNVPPELAHCVWVSFRHSVGKSQQPSGSHWQPPALWAHD